MSSAALAMTEATTLPAITGSPEYDQMCRAFLDAQSRYAKASEDLDNAKKPLLAYVKDNGIIPPSAEKTKRIRSAQFIADVTTGTTIEIVEPLVDQLQADLKLRKKSSLFAQVFETTHKHTLRENATEIFKLGIANFNSGDRASLLSTFAQCFLPKPKSPSLNVQTTMAFEEKERLAAEKAAKKAAKKAASKAKAVKKGAAK